MNCLYLVRYGDKVKVGVTYELAGRYTAYRSDARRDSVEFAPLFELPPHSEAQDNERAILDRFGTRGSRSEYLDADPDAVIAFARSLPCTPVPVPERASESERWLDRIEAAHLLRVSPATVDRYARSGHLPRYRNSITRRVRFRIEDVRDFARRAVA